MLKQWWKTIELLLLCGGLIVGAGSIMRSSIVDTPIVTTTTTEPTTINSIGTYIITAYTTYESCHNPQNNVCLMADGKPVELGAIACPREFELGTKFLIDGKEYICQDRTALRYDGRFDIFMGDGYDAYLKAKEWGIKYLEVKIVK